MISETIYEYRPVVSHRITSPCKGCESRYPACSMHCNAFKEFKTELEKAHEWLKEYKNSEVYNREQDKYTKKLRWRKKTYGK